MPVFDKMEEISRCWVSSQFVLLIHQIVIPPQKYKRDGYQTLNICVNLAVLNPLAKWKMYF